MKRMAKSALTLLLCAVLLLSLPAVASDKTGTKTFYDQLDGYAQGIYNAFCRSDVQGWLRTGEKFTLTFDGPFSDAQAAANAIAQAETWALAAFELDYPDFFWLRGSDVNVSGNSDKLTMTVTTNFWNNWANGSRSVFDDEAAVTAAVRRIAGEARAQGGTYEQLLYIHDWLTLNNQYNLAATESKDKESNRVPYTPVSALTGEEDPVCEGYAQAYKLLCDELDIPCLYVIGYAWTGSAWSLHTWNQVLLEGQWYAVDATFDDPTGGASGKVSGLERHDYFLAGAQTVAGGYYFSDTHSPTGEKISDIPFTYPDLASEAYGGGYTEPENPYWGDEPEWPDEPEYPDDPYWGDEPEWPDEPEYPEEPDYGSLFRRQDIPEAGTAVESILTVTIDEEKVTLPAYALLDEKGNPTNYVRLRDLAALLNGTEAEFDVLWSKATGISIEPWCSYDHPNGTEGNVPFSGDQPYTVYLEDTLVDGMPLSLTAFQISWEGGSHTYYQLRDLGRAMSFNVGWTRERGLFIEPDEFYTDED